MFFTEMNITYGLVGGLFGLLLGSAINAMVWRIKVGRSWTKGRSECPDCGHVLAAKDLVPVFSWLALKGKCRYCHKPIKDHPIVEIITAVLFSVSAAVLAPQAGFEGVMFIFLLVILVMLEVLAVYDAKWMNLPDKVNFAFMGGALVYSVVMAAWTRSPQVLYGALEAGVLAGGMFWLLVYGTRGRAMGGGDIKLAAGMGLLLGLQGTAVALLLAFNVAAIVGVIMIVVKRRARSTAIAFGPYLVGGTIIAFLWGRELSGWYLQLSGFGL
jgi:leader peptidase (prepilin peptidase)/N-methyltransferase